MSNLSVRVSAVAVAAGLVIAACGGGSESGADATVAEPTVVTNPPVTEPSVETNPPATDAPALPVDEPRCGTAVDDGEYEPIDCAEPHDAEFAGFVTAASDPATDDDPEFDLELMRLCADPVAALTSRPTALFGIDVGSVHDADAGAENNVECWAVMSTPASLIGSLRDIELEQALGDYSLVVGMDPGTCYVAPDEGYDVGTITDCSDPDVVQLVSLVTSRFDEFDDDAITDDGFVMCEREIADADFELIGSSYSLLTPIEEGWKALDRRTIVCLMERGDDDVVEVAQANADQPCAVRAPNSYPVAPCNELHAAEFAGSVPSPVDVLPEDADEATLMGTRACRQTVLDFVGVDRLPFGVAIGFSVDAGLGDAIVSDLDCFVSTDLDDGLLGSISDVGLTEALQKVVVPETEPGSCFVLGDKSFFLAEASDCTDDGALMFIGTFDLDDGPYPGEDAIREVRAVECARVLEESGLAADPASVSGTFPGPTEWAVNGDRTVACDAAPI